MVILLDKPGGGYLYRVFSHQKTLLDPVLAPVERFLNQIAGVDTTHEMSGVEYALALLLFSLTGTLLLYAALRLQTLLPGAVNGANLATPLTPDLAFNTSASFSTTTTWQAYAGETTMTYVSQIVGLTAQTFLAGAAGLAVGVAFLRGFAGRQTSRRAPSMQ